ncbi:hypothetical protein C5E06_03935 [Pseudoclavibacter sp. RFBI5]|nr:hypothetical protein C5E06_03935 [Pseudoclavibacter sp. RFBI5]
MRGRKTWMDLLRGSAILLVILFHASALPVILIFVPPTEFVADLNTFFGPYRMSMLLVLSGMLLGRSLSKPAGVYYVSKVRTIVWPYLVWAVIYWLVSGQEEWMDPSAWIATSWLWFLFFLAIYYAAAPLLARVRGPLFAIVPVVLWSLSVLLPDGDLTNLAYYGGFFFAGHFVATWRATFTRFETIPWMLGLLAIAVTFSLLLVAQDHAYYFGLGSHLGVSPGGPGELVDALDGPTIDNPTGEVAGADNGTVIDRLSVLWIPVVLAGIAGIIMWVRRVTGALEGRGADAAKWLQYIGRNSVVFYVVHYPTQIWITFRLGEAGVVDSNTTFWACTLGALGMSYLACWLRRFRLFDAFFVFPKLRSTTPAQQARVTSSS